MDRKYERHGNCKENWNYNETYTYKQKETAEILGTHNDDRKMVKNRNLFRATKG